MRVMKGSAPEMRIVEPEAAQTARGVRILLVEDRPEHVEWIKHTLQDHDHGEFQVRSAISLVAALVALEGESFDCAVLDLTLPDSHGPSAVTSLRARAPDLPIVVLTSLDNEEFARRALRLGAQDYLVKGHVDADLLVRSIRYSIERGHSQHLLREVNEDLRARTERITDLYKDLKRSHDELEEAQLSLIEAEKENCVGRLAAGVAHEVKNPLQIVQMGFDYLKRHITNDQPETELVLSDMEDALQRASLIINGLLDFARPTKLQLARTDLNDVADRLLSLVQYEVDLHRVSVVKEFSAGLPHLMADAAKLGQAFLNLYLNAIRAMSEGGTLTVRTYAQPLCEIEELSAEAHGENEEAVVAEIQDTGPGIPEDKLQAIYAPFFTTKPPGQGVGLGLSVTRNIVELHGGRLDIRNMAQSGVKARLLFVAERERKT